MNSPSSSELSSLSSGLSSVGSLSPPPEYPSPPPSQDYSPSAIEKPSDKRPREGEDAPPAKKRRKVEPKPRTTQHLSLASPTSLPNDQRAQLALLLKLLRKRRKIVVIAGAGISVSAGSMYFPACQSYLLTDLKPVPDFRSSEGLFATLRTEHKLRSSGKDLFDASVYQTDASTAEFHNMVRSLSEKVAAAKPTAFHHLIARLAAEGRLMRLYTQNVDGLETSLPPLQTTYPLSNKGPWPRTVQLHGAIEKMVCSKCNHVSDLEPALFNGSVAPPCPVCIETDKVRTDHAGKRSHGIGRLRPRMVLYNEHNPDEEAIGTVVSADLRTRPDAVIVVGTSMKVPGLKRIVREMCGVVRSRRDGLSVWINLEPPPSGKEFEDCWDLVVEGECDNVAAHANMKRWDDHSVDYQECTESDTERAKARNPDVRVVIETPAKKKIASSLLTPAASPRSKSLEAPTQPKIAVKMPAVKEIAKSATDTFKSGLSRPLAGNNKISKPAKKKPPKAKKPLAAVKPTNAKITTTFKTTKPLQNPSASQKILAKSQTPKQDILSEDEGSRLAKPMMDNLHDGTQPYRPPPPIQTTLLGLPLKERNPIRLSIEKREQQRSISIESLDENFEPEALPAIKPVSPDLPSQPNGQAQCTNTINLFEGSPPPLSPGFTIVQTTPSRPHWERSVTPPSPDFVVTQTSPSRPYYEKFILPPPVHHQKSGFASAKHTATAPAKLLFTKTSKRRNEQQLSAGSPHDPFAPPHLVIDVEKATETQCGRGRLKRLSEEIVSPTSVPQSMEGLLN
ncbi:MAG: hypothetical protein Q9191_006870 [Dirinaria sp. TL-2023a]